MRLDRKGDGHCLHDRLRLSLAVGTEPLLLLDELANVGHLLLLLHWNLPRLPPVLGVVNKMLE